MPCQCRWLGSKLKPNSGRWLSRFESPLGRVDVEGDLGGMDFQGELDAALGEDVENRVEAIGEDLEAVVDHLRRRPAGTVEQVPDRAAGEAVDDADAQLLRRAGRVFISSAARWWTPSGLPSPQTWAGRIALCRSSIVSQTAWPTRWFEIA